MKPIATMAPMELMIKGRMCRGAVCAIEIVTPENIPAAPRPATERPMMRDMLVGARAHIREPISKMTRTARNVHLIEKLEYT